MPNQPTWGNQYPMNNQNGMIQNNQPVQQSQPTMPVRQQQGISSIAEVYSRDGVEFYPVAAGTTALLIQFLSQSEGKFWLKATDMYGRPAPLIEYSFNIVQDPMNQYQQVQQQSVQSQSSNNYVTHEEIDEMKKMIADLHAALK